MAKKPIFSIANILARIFAFVISPFFIALMLIYAIFALLIDLIAYLKDSAYLEPDEIKKRKVDRSRDTEHKLLNKALELIVNYFKFIFLGS